MRYLSGFLRVIPLLQADYIRVTHPCAGRHRYQQADTMLPLDLHVLGLSLAFILSQDQTLRCIIFFFFFSLYNLLARDGDLFLVSYYFFVYCNFFKDRLLFSLENGLQI